MKGNQEPMLYTTNAAVAALNHVPGFDPLKFLRRTPWARAEVEALYLDSLSDEGNTAQAEPAFNPWANSRIIKS